MLDHDESPEKPQYSMAPPPPHFALPHPFLAKIFRPLPPPISINFEKVEPPAIPL